MKPIKILALSGSARTDSFNKKLVQLAIQGAKQAGGEVTFIDLRDFALPIYDGDLEEKDGLPAHALKLKELLSSHHALLIGSPEHNSSFSSLLKNTIDWASRPIDEEDGLAPFKNKVAAIFSASPGSLGGLRGLSQLRWVLENIGVWVLPDQLAVPRAADAFSTEGKLNNSKQQAVIESIGAKLVKATTSLQAIFQS